MSIIILNKQRWLIAKETAGLEANDKKIIEEYKKICTGWIEGSNKELHNQPCYLRFMDKGKIKKAIKKIKKGKK